MATVRIGLTGGLASGKSTLARLLETRGITVLDADRLVAKLYAPGEEGTGAVERLFGRKLLRPDGSVDRSQLAQRVFSDPAALAELERAIHPLVAERFSKWAAQQPGPVVLEATRLVEAGMTADLDGVVTVEAPVELRRRRALARGMPPGDVEARLEAQGDGSARRRASSFTVTNTGTPDDLARAADAVAAWIRSLETRPSPTPREKCQVSDPGGAPVQAPASWDPSPGT